MCLEYPRGGNRRETAQRRRKDFHVDHGRVRRTMAMESLHCHVKRRFMRATVSNHGFRRFPNLVLDPAVSRFSQVWVVEANGLVIVERLITSTTWSAAIRSLREDPDRRKNVEARVGNSMSDLPGLTGEQFNSLPQVIQGESKEIWYAGQGRVVIRSMPASH